MEADYLPLGCCVSGEAVRVQQIGTDTAFANRLRAMGIHDGAELDVVQTGATMIVRLNHGSRLCLRSDDVAHIWVTRMRPAVDWSSAPLPVEGVNASH
jgi:Fe2+ transport system protein FeoA